jgi:5'-3' exonuclease
VFDGKTPEIKKKKIEERKKNLKDNLIKLRDLKEKKNTLNNYINLLSSSSNHLDLDNEDILLNESNKDDNLIFGTPPVDIFNLEEEINKMNNIQEEYKKIYKKSIVMKDYYIKDWIEILELLGLPVIKATGEADPLCAYLLKSNSHIYGIISDDSDMLVFGAPILMRKSINQQFTIIELKLLLEKIEILLKHEFNSDIEFNINNLIDFSIMLGTDYGTVKTNENFLNSKELLKYYVINDKDYKKIISPDQYENFETIKKYYTIQDFENLNFDITKKPVWNKPKLMEGIKNNDASFLSNSIYQNKLVGVRAFQSLEIPEVISDEQNQTHQHQLKNNLAHPLKQ